MATPQKKRRLWMGVYYALVAVISIAVFLRFDDLFGNGWTYACGIGLILWSIPHALMSPDYSRRIAGFLLVPIALFILVVMIAPTYWNPSLQFAVDSWQWERELKRDLNAILETDREFSNLSVSAMKTKTIWLIVSGTMKSQKDFQRLRVTIKELRPGLLSMIKWNIHFTDGATPINDFE